MEEGRLEAEESVGSTGDGGGARREAVCWRTGDETGFRGAEEGVKECVKLPASLAVGQDLGCGIK